MDLQLIANGLRQALGGQIFQVVDQKIRDPHLTQLTPLLHLQKGLVRSIPQSRIHTRSMEQHPIHIIQAQAA